MSVIPDLQIPRNSSLGFGIPNFEFQLYKLEHHAVGCGSPRMAAASISTPNLSPSSRVNNSSFFVARLRLQRRISCSAALLRL
jgi:hypothetical protein